MLDGNRGGSCGNRGGLVKYSRVVRVGSLATASRELRQAREGAAVAVMPGAEEELARISFWCNRELMV